MNRLIAVSLAELLFAPTERNRHALLREGRPDDRILVISNTLIDELLTLAAQPYDWSAGQYS